MTTRRTNVHGRPSQQSGRCSGDPLAPRRWYARPGVRPMGDAPVQTDTCAPVSELMWLEASWQKNRAPNGKKTTPEQ